MKITLATTLSIGLLGSVRAANHGKPGQRHQGVTKRENTLVKRDYSGMATFYNAETGQAGACGSLISNTDWTVAIKGSMYGDYGQKSYWCGKSITITGNGKTTTAVVADACPGCQGAGGLDMTPGLFSFFIDQSAGVMPITWHLAGDDTPAPAPSTSQYTPPAPAWTPSSSSQWTPEWTPSSSSWTPQWTPSSSSSQWTPEWTPSSSSSWTPEWTPSSSSWTPEWTPSSSSSQWTPSSSSSQWTPSTTSTSWSSSKTSSSWSSSASHKATSTGKNSTSTATHLSNSTMSSVNATNTASISGSANATSTILTGDAAAKTGASSSAKNGSAAGQVGGTGGNLGRTAQILVDLAGLAVAAAPHK